MPLDRFAVPTASLVVLRDRRDRRPAGRAAALHARTPVNPPSDRQADPVLEETALLASYRTAAATACERLVSISFSISVDALHARTRSTAQIAWARQVAMYLTHCVFQISQTEVGRRFGRDRTTVKHACRRVEDMRDDPQFEARICALEAALQGMRDAMRLFAVQTELTDPVLAQLGVERDDREPAL